MDLPAVSDIRFIDDGSPQSGELMNLLIRRNLLFRIAKPGESGSGPVVRLGSKEYPKAEAANPSLLAEKVRANLTDEKAFFAYLWQRGCYRPASCGRRLSSTVSD